MDIVTKETFKTKVQKLVEQFSDNEPYYKSSKYKEDELRQEFINPFFKALGWDMDNEQGFAPQYREVIHEDRIEIEGKPKAPDYAFKVGSDRKFFVEAKASSVRVFSEIDPAFQLRRYAWSGQLPVSILTDFEEFSIYDTTLEPKHTDKSSVARVKYINYKDYLKEADYLWDTFSKEAVWKGSFDKFAKREKKGSQLVDKSFLKEIELWRDLVAKDVASNNNLNIYELNSVVQKFIDRIIFLRIAEDRGVESYETLRSAVKSPDTYSQLLKIFSRADEKYNSSLFDLKKDELSTKIKISDKTLDRILNNLYYPKSPYEFSVIGVDILGSVYEQFLGKVIRLTKGGNAVIEEKPEVKKAGGVYYTPQYIVDYIVKNTVGELVKDKTPKDVAKLKIVDPACGSGSFLIGAYNYLLNWHHKYYVENEVEKNLKAKKLFKDGEGNYFLSTQEKKEILLNNIHGVDIDPQAVEVTKLSLALKMLEGENSETINAQYKLFADRILPDLSSNIKCGNSLIGSDYYSDKQITLLGDEELRKVNAFDWDKEFPFIFRSGGFDAVIGNPPYIKEYTDKEAFNFKDGILGKYYQGKMDLWYAFTCFGIDILKKKGLLSFIAPNNWNTNAGASIMREKLLQDTKILKYIDFNEFKVFSNASIQTMIFVIQKDSNDKAFSFRYTKLQQRDIEISTIEDVLKNRGSEIKYLTFETELERNSSDPLISFLDRRTNRLLNKISNAGNYYLQEKDVAQGIVAPQDTVNNSHLTKLRLDPSKKGMGIFNLNSDELQDLNLSEREKADLIKPFYTTDQLEKYYSIKDNILWVIYTDKKRRENINSYPIIKNHLNQYKEIITSDFKPYGLHRAREERFFLGEKIISLRKSKYGCFTYTDFPCYVSQTYYVIKPSNIDLKYLTGLLNSKLIYFWLYHKGKKQGEQLQVDKAPLLEIPIVYNGEKEIRAVKEIVEKILQIGNQIKDVGNSPEIKNTLRKQQEIYEKQIDNLTYTLYRMDSQEISIIENFFRSNNSNSAVR